MTIRASTFAGGGKLRASFFSGGLTVPSSTLAGDIITITAPSGKFVRLDSLRCNGLSSDGNVNANFTIDTDGITVIDDKSLGQGSNGDFAVSQNGSMQAMPGATSGQANVNNIIASDIIGSVITISTTTTTAHITIYSYSVLENY